MTARSQAWWRPAVAVEAVARLTVSMEDQGAVADLVVVAEEAVPPIRGTMVVMVIRSALVIMEEEVAVERILREEQASPIAREVMEVLDHTMGTYSEIPLAITDTSQVVVEEVSQVLAPEEAEDSVEEVMEEAEPQTEIPL